LASFFCGLAIPFLDLKTLIARLDGCQILATAFGIYQERNPERVPPPSFQCAWFIVLGFSLTICPEW